MPDNEHDNRKVEEEDQKEEIEKRIDKQEEKRNCSNKEYNRIDMISSRVVKNIGLSLQIQHVSVCVCV